MIYRPLHPGEEKAFDLAAGHPLQSFTWGEFRKKTGVEVERIAGFEGSNLKSAIQVTFHPVPHTPFTVGYMPKGPMPDEQMLSVLEEIGKRHKALLIKLEPNVLAPVTSPVGHKEIISFLEAHHCVPGRPLFTKYTFVLPLEGSEEELLANMRPKTRYNLKLAEKKDVRIVEDSTEAGLGDYLKLLFETTKRQGFYAHDEQYFKDMWQIMSSTGIAHIFKAVYDGKVLSAWIVFVFNKTLYYPYGASSREHKDLMANNLLMWEVIKFGKAQGCTSFDMWGSLGPDPNPKDPWYGFHRFKEGYGAQLMQSAGSFDLIINFQYYSLFRLLEDWRWKFLRLKSALLR